MWEWLVLTAREWSLLSMAIRLLSAMLVGIIIGIDRGVKRRGAGLKTHVIVCIGAAAVMMTSQYINQYYPGGADLSRMGAQVISGVGFLGVGTIVITGRHQVRGLTTAAGLWTCACIGLAAGIGYIEGVILCTIFALFTFKALNYIDHVLVRYTKVFDVYFEFESDRSLIGFRELLRRKGLKLQMFELSKNSIMGDGPTAIASIEVKDRKNRVNLVDVLSTLEGVKYVEEL